jgi:hypothetical protein
LRGVAGGQEIGFGFVDRGTAGAHLLDQREHRAAERHQVAQPLAA